jgi:hypothetical protein
MEDTQMNSASRPYTRGPSLIAITLSWPYGLENQRVIGHKVGSPLVPVKML